jgi:hypothetical protein
VFILGSQLSFKSERVLDQEYFLYYRRSSKWVALGRYVQAMEDDDECLWEMSDEKIPELHLLIVSLIV